MHCFVGRKLRISGIQKFAPLMVRRMWRENEGRLTFLLRIGDRIFASSGLRDVALRMWGGNPSSAHSRGRRFFSVCGTVG